VKKYVDGQYIEMTAEEIAEMDKMNELIVVEPTVLERLEAVEAAILEGVLTNG
jgi:hypothetical protein